MTPYPASHTFASIYESARTELDIYPAFSEDKGHYAALALRSGAAHLQFYATYADLLTLIAKLREAAAEIERQS
jgi:hypothetical protein